MPELRTIGMGKIPTCAQFLMSLGLDHVIKTKQPQRPSFTRSTTTPISVSLFGMLNALELVGVGHVIMTKD
jgi:hypothetical protein